MAFGPKRRHNTTALLEMDRVATRAGYYRYEILDQDLAILGTLDVTRNKPPKIRNDTTRKIKRTLSGLEIDPVTASDLNPIGTLIRPVAILEDGSEYRRGAFMFVDASRSRMRSGLELDGSLHDQLFILDQKTDKTISIPSGRNISAAIEAMARRFGLRRVNIESTSRVIGTPIAWPAGDSTGLDIVSELCAMAGFYSPFFDNDGVFTVISAPAPHYAVPTLFYEDGSDGRGRIIADSAVESDDLLDAPNRFIAIDDSATKTPIVGKYDLPDSSPISIAQRGFPVVEIKSMQGLSDQAAAEKAAQTMAAESNAGYVVFQFDAVPDYRHDTFDVVQYRNRVCRQVSWEETCDPTEPMSHELREFYQ